MNQTTGSQAKKGSRLRNDLTAGPRPQEDDPQEMNDNY